MQVTHIWNKFNLYSAKVVIGIAFLLCVATSLEAQHKTRWIKKNNPNYDDRKLTYGFLIGLHTTAYKIRYSEKFVSKAFDTLYAVEPLWYPGFSLGFIVNYKVGDFFDLRITPKVAFYEYRVQYLYTDETPTDVQPIDNTMVEFPILLKYKSERRGNIRMYMVGGIKPGFEASGNKRETNDVLEVKNINFNVDFGFGFDMYYPLFKFSPEIRFSKGIVDMLDNRTNKYGQPLDKITTNTITVYLLFQ